MNRVSVGLLVGFFVGAGVRPAQASPIQCSSFNRVSTLPAPCTASLLDATSLVSDLESGPSTESSTGGFSHGSISTNFGHGSLFLAGSPIGLSEWIDTFDITGSSGQSTAVFGWTLTGTATQSGLSTCFPGEDVGAAGGPDGLTDTGTPVLEQFETASACLPDSLVVDQSGTFWIDFTYGTPFDFGLGRHRLSHAGLAGSLS